MAKWRLTYGAEFWWSPDEAELLPDRFATQPFGYPEIDRVTVYRECRAGKDVFQCDWAAVKAGMAAAEGVRVVLRESVRPWPSSPPTEALEISANSELAAPADRPRECCD
jgi:hypothetical protein